MRLPLSLAAATAALASLLFSSSAAGAGKPEDELAAAIKAFYSQSFTAEWGALEALPGIQWAPLPPTELKNCLPDGGCYTRQGKAVRWQSGTGPIRAAAR